MIKWFKSLQCYFDDHIPEKFLTETDGWINTYRCSRCHCILGQTYWKWKGIPPPNSTSEQIKMWENFCEEKYQKLRDSVKDA